MAVYRAFTVSSGTVEEGARVDRLNLKGAGIEIPAILIGQSGRGRSLGVLPVRLTNNQHKGWQDEKGAEVFFAEVGQTKAGKPKLLSRTAADSEEKIIVIFRTKIGFRGSNSHTGDRTGETREEYGEEYPIFSEFPGEIIAEGVIAQGGAGRMGSGHQLIAVMPKGIVFRTGYGGRLYGAPSAHYYKWDGKQLIAVTWEEREVSDIF